VGKPVVGTTVGRKVRVGEIDGMAVGVKVGLTDKVGEIVG
jgi:hypothetical protein